QPGADRVLTVARRRGRADLRAVRDGRGRLGGRRRPRADRGHGAPEPHARRRQAHEPARMTTVLVEVPYFLGRRGEGLATGVPVLAETLAAELDARRVVVDAGEVSWNEVGASMDVVRALARAVGDVVADGDFPLVLAGVCSSS